LADGWESWIAYQRAFSFLFTGFVEYAIGLLIYFVWPLRFWYWSERYRQRVLWHLLPLLMALVLFFVVGYVLRKYKDAEQPWDKLNPFSAS
jgi:hypothetical protein